MGTGTLVRLAALPGLVLGMLGSTGCDDHQALEVRLEATSWSLFGPGVIYRRGGTRWVEADLRSSSGATAMLRLRQRPAWVSVILRTPDGDRLTPEGAVELVGPADPKAGDTWLIAREGLQVRVEFAGDVPPIEPRRPPPPSNPWAPLPADPVPPTRYEDDGSGCGGDPVDDPEPPPGYGDGDDGSGCGGDPVDEPMPRNDNERWLDDEDDGSGCGGDPVGAPTPDNDNERWLDDEDDGSGCGGDPVGDEVSSDTDGGCDDLEGDEVDARVAARSFRTFWPIAVVVGFNRGRRRRSPGRSNR